MNKLNRPSKRVLAASFLVTVGSLVACGGSSHDPEMPEMTHNPPMPTGTVLQVEPTPEPTAQPDDQPPDAEPPHPEPYRDPHPELQDAPANRPGRILREGDSCVWVADAPPARPCPAGMSCNPPPQEAFPVRCPTAQPPLPSAPPGVQVQTRADGTCFYMPRTPPCKPGVRCNPPAPEEHDVSCR